MRHDLYVTFLVVCIIHIAIPLLICNNLKNGRMAFYSIPGFSQLFPQISFVRLLFTKTK